VNCRIADALEFRYESVIERRGHAGQGGRRIYG
jgi:hypothetical protein